MLLEEEATAGKYLCNGPIAKIGIGKSLWQVSSEDCSSSWKVLKMSPDDDLVSLIILRSRS